MKLYIFFLSIFLCLYLLFNVSTALTRNKRQESSGGGGGGGDAAGENEEDLVKGQVCDFGSGSLLQTCGWVVPNASHPMVRWRTAQGAQEFWLGGPPRDHTLTDSSGGYAYFETSYQMPSMPRTTIVPNKYASPSNNISFSGRLMSSSGGSNNELLRPFISQLPLFQVTRETTKEIPVPDDGVLQSPNITNTGPQGVCLSFFYSIDGLSTESLEVILQDAARPKYNRTLIIFNDVTEAEWRRAEVAYAYSSTHRMLLKANAKRLGHIERTFRGYIAIDDIQVKTMEEGGGSAANAEEPCKGHCTFEAGLCGWTNQEEGDDFDWRLGRGSQNIFTGPARDYSSFANNEISGGYVFINSAYPRRPGDVAVLLSPVMNPTSKYYLLKIMKHVLYYFQSYFR